MGRKISDETRMKYLRIKEEAEKLIDGEQIFRSKGALRKELCLTKTEMNELFRRHPEIDERWKTRKRPEESERTEESKKKYADLRDKAIRVMMSGQKFQKRKDLGKVIGATEFESQEVFRRHPELVEIWEKESKIYVEMQKPMKNPEKKRRRRRCLTPLERDVREAREAGLSYGKWRAQKEEEKKNGWRT